MPEFECKKCHTVCQVDGDYPKFFCWCEECGDYAKGFDDSLYAADFMAIRIEEAELRMDEMR